MIVQCINFHQVPREILKTPGFPIGILGHVWYLIVSIPDPCNLTNFEYGRVGTCTFVLRFFETEVMGVR